MVNTTGKAASAFLVRCQIAKLLGGDMCMREKTYETLYTAIFSKMIQIIVNDF